MRKSFLFLFTGLFALLSGVAAASVSARPIDSAPVELAVDGTFTAPGSPSTPFQGTVFVDSFVTQDGSLALTGTLVPPDDVPFAPLAVSLPATVRATDDAASGCTVTIETTATFINPDFIVFLNGASLSLSEATDPDSARELCRVVQTATRDPADQSALARVLNKVLRNS
jgi:hypothetical protein